MRIARMSVQVCVCVHETIADANMNKKQVEDHKKSVKLSLSCNKTALRMYQYGF